MTHDAYRPKEPVEFRRQATEMLRGEISEKFTEALLDNVVEIGDLPNDTEGHFSRASVLVEDTTNNIYRLCMQGSENSQERIYSIENYSRFGKATPRLTVGRATLQFTEKPGVLIEDHRTEGSVLVDDPETIQFFAEIIRTSKLLTAEEKEQHVRAIKGDMLALMGIDKGEEK